jgi:hypothetical protein
MDNICTDTDLDYEPNRAECLGCYLSEYGIEVESGTLDGNYISGLREVAKAVFVVGTRLANLLRACGITDVSPHEAFRRIFGSVSFVYLNAGTRASGLTRGQTIEIPEELFNSLRDTSADDSSVQDLQLLIAHELGHVFQNRLGAYPDGTRAICYSPINERPYHVGGENDCNGFFVPIPNGTPINAVYYIVSTGSYWNGDTVDDGSWRSQGTYREGEFGVRQVNGIWVRPARTYIPNYGGFAETNPNLLELYFHNENRRDDPDPTEGFSDTLAIYLRYGEARLIEVLGNDPRAEFFQHNMCRWLRQLFGA